MERVVLALASNERYYPGLYCAVASALNHVSWKTSVNLWVLDGGISCPPRDTFSKLIDRVRGVVRLEFVTVDPSVFGKATLRPGRSHMTYCRILLPHLLHVPRVIYLDCDVLVFRDLAQLFAATSKAAYAKNTCETDSLRRGVEVRACLKNLRRRTGASK
jgi:lipopolysaccharide biosynthesis glycosyltransferase